MQLKLRIHSVKCVDETGGKYVEKFGNDEIYLGGFCLGPNGIPVKIQNFSVYADFDDGDVKNYNPPHVFATLDMGDIKTWPKNFAVCFLMFEKDNGGMDGMLESAFNKFKEEVNSHKSVARTEAGQEQFVFPWTIIFSTIIPLVANYLKDKLSKAISDDAFPLEATTLAIPSADFTWNNQHISPINKMEFRGNDGVYYVFYDWEITGYSTTVYNTLEATVRDHRR